MASLIKFLIAVSLAALSAASSTPSTTTTTTESPVEIVTMASLANILQQQTAAISQKAPVVAEPLTSICDAEDPVAIIERTDECIVDPVVKQIIMACRQVSYGSSE